MWFQVLKENVKEIINLNQSMRSTRNEIKKFILNSLKIKLKKMSINLTLI